MMGITDAMKQYEKSSEDMLKTQKTKRPTRAGIKLPDAPKLVAALTVVFVLAIAMAEFV